MHFLRAVLFFLAGLILGMAQVGLVSVWPLPYSALPLFPVLISLAFVLRSRPTVFWPLLIGIIIFDLYSGNFFGSAILTFLFIVYFGVRLASDLFTHRSLIGCAVVSFVVGFLWIFLMMFFNWLIAWFTKNDSVFYFSQILAVALLEAISTALLTSLLYLLVLRLLKGHSPLAIGIRGL